MTELSLRSDFPKLDEAEWRALVDKALKGAEFEKALVSKTYDDLTIKPLYTRNDAISPNETGAPGEAPYIRGVKTKSAETSWDIRQLLCDPEPAKANALILEDLEGGVSSVLLRVSAAGQSGVNIHSKDDLAATLDGVFLDYATISLDAGPDTARIVLLLEELWSSKGISPDKALAEWNADPLGTLARTGGLPGDFSQSYDELAELVTKANDKYPQVKAVLASGIPYHEAGASEAEEIACLGATLVAYLRALEERGIAPSQALPKIAFALSADTDFFLNIAKIRAARAVIHQIAKSSGAEEAAKTMHISVNTSERMMAKRDPYVNMLRTTLAAAGGALGGADAVMVLPYTWPVGLPDRFARRIARNTQLVLQEESSLGRIVDPAGGSWFIEQITKELKEKAWTLFQQIEAEGGMAEALQKAFVQDMIRSTRDERAKDIATAKIDLTGVSAFPHLAEDAIKTSPHPVPQPMSDEAITAEPLPLNRLGEPFEKLRDASDRYLEQTKARPAIFLANLGQLKDFNARATYARNFFAAGGIETISSDGFKSPTELADAFKDSGAKIACLCSSDKIYAELAVDAANALKDAGATHIYMAGRAGEMRDALKAAGISTFIFKGCDMLEVLGEAHDLLDLS